MGLFEGVKLEEKNRCVGMLFRSFFCGVFNLCPYFIIFLSIFNTQIPELCAKFRHNRVICSDLQHSG